MVARGTARETTRGMARERGMIAIVSKSFFFSGNLLGDENDELGAKIKNDISIKDI